MFKYRNKQLMSSLEFIVKYVETRIKPQIKFITHIFFSIFSPQVKNDPENKTGFQLLRMNGVLFQMCVNHNKILSKGS